MFDFLIAGCQYPDFTAHELKTGSVAIHNGKIVGVFSLAEKPKAKTVIEADGKILSPGFIDIHMHEENFIAEGNQYSIANLMCCMGVTTCIAGNCGTQYQDLSYFKSVISELGGAPSNYIMLAGYNHYREKMGIGRYNAATKKQQDELVGILKRELREGAYGISFGLEYDPGISTEEVIYVLSAFEDSNLLISIHSRTDSDRAIEGIEEMIEIANRCGKNVQISHLCSDAAEEKMAEALNLIDEARKTNFKIDFDTYPYNAFSTEIGSAVFDDGWVDKWGKGYDCLMLVNEPYKGQYCNEKLFFKVRSEMPEMQVVAFVMNENEIAAAIADRNGMIASDGSCVRGEGHPRGGGTFPRVLAKYVREDHVISMIDALEKMTLRPAQRLGIENKKGQIIKGQDADLVLFNPQTIQDKSTFTQLKAKPDGIEYVFVNGKIAVDHGELTGVLAGKFIEYLSN